jgi:hypothetical protein
MWKGSDMNSPYVTTAPATHVQPLGLPASPAATRRLLTAYATAHGAALTSLLDACHSPAAGDRARALVAHAGRSTPDAVAVCTLAAHLREDLLDIFCAPELVEPDKLHGIASETLDAATLYHGARLDELLEAIGPRLPEPR